MNRDQLRAEFVTMIQPFVRNTKSEEINESSSFVNDLNVQSARLIDIILEMEDKFAIRIDDEEAGALTTVGSAVDLLIAKLSEKEEAAA